ncbi:MAG: SPOR domain-containing protein, partial [candidate division KSB1 bacterium]|nr:SPOR domain-containing protein [candidate division KSB1 bacterium]
MENYGETNFIPMESEQEARRIPSNDSTRVFDEHLSLPKLQLTVLDKSKDSFPNRSFSDGKYVLQIGAFSNKDNAMNQQNYLSKQGYQVEIAEKTVKGQRFYAVYLGNFETEQEAQTFGEEFKRKYGLSFRVVSKSP